MQVLANVLVGLVALIHLYILVLEMFLWKTPRGQKAFGLTPEFAAETATLGANQGLYNGFLATALIWGLLTTDPTGFQLKLFGLSCVIVAGIYGALTASRKILFVQVVPGTLALIALLVAR